MPDASTALSIKTILLDIEGTTTRAEFVTQVLFPYARRRVEPFLRDHSSDPGVRADLEGLEREHAQDVALGLNPPPWPEARSLGGRADQHPPTAVTEQSMVEAIRYLHWLMDRDRKSTSLKSLQGRIWEAGYDAGELRGEVYDDVPRAFERWQGQGREIAIFSSGSLLAQKLLFRSTVTGNLTKFIRAYFDTTTGAKREADSYRRIAQALGVQPFAILFISDTIAELDAARSAGVETALCVRSPLPMPAPGEHAVIRTFDDVFP